jgi:hypothetical protein
MKGKLINKYQSGKDQMTYEYEQYYKDWDVGRLLGGFVLGIIVGCFLFFIGMIFTVPICMYIVGQKEKTRIVSKIQYISKEDLEKIP